MPDYLSRQQLKKKVIDRWENEGGKIYAEETKSLESSQPDEQEREGNRPPSSHGDGSNAGIKRSGKSSDISRNFDFIKGE